MSDTRERLTPFEQFRAEMDAIVRVPRAPKIERAAACERNVRREMIAAHDRAAGRHHVIDQSRLSCERHVQARRLRVFDAWTRGDRGRAKLAVKEGVSESAIGNDLLALRLAGLIRVHQ